MIPENSARKEKAHGFRQNMQSLPTPTGKAVSCHCAGAQLADCPGQPTRLPLRESTSRVSSQGQQAEAALPPRELKGYLCRHVVTGHHIYSCITLLKTWPMHNWNTCLLKQSDFVCFIPQDFLQGNSSFSVLRNLSPREAG